MPITLPSYVAPNELIQSAWGNAVVNALAEIDDEFVEKAGDTMTGALTVNSNLTCLAAFVTAGQQAGVNALTRKDYVDTQILTRVSEAGDTMTGTLSIEPAGATVPLILKNGSDTPRVRFQSMAGTVMGDLAASGSFLNLETLSNNPFLVNAPTTIETGSGSTALKLKAVTETPVLDLQSTAGTSLMTLTAGAATSTIDAFDDLKLRTNGSDAVTVDGGTQNVTLAGGLTVTTAATLGGALDHNGTTVGFYGVAPTTRQTGYTTFANLTTDRTCDANTVLVAELADIVGTLIEDLKATGIIGA